MIDPTKVHPILIVAFIEAHKRAQRLHAEAHALSGLATILRKAVEAEVAEQLGLPANEIDMGSLSCCPSPFGLCVYHDDEKCIFCGCAGKLKDNED